MTRFPRAFIASVRGRAVDLARAAAVPADLQRADADADTCVAEVTPGAVKILSTAHFGRFGNTSIRAWSAGGNSAVRGFDRRCQAPASRIGALLRAGHAADAYVLLDPEPPGALVFAMIHETADSIADGADPDRAMLALTTALNRLVLAPDGGPDVTVASEAVSDRGDRDGGPVEPGSVTDAG